MKDILIGSPKIKLEFFEESEANYLFIRFFLKKSEGRGNEE